MNIFLLHTDPKLCAQAHCDRHTIKMIVEYSQLLSTAHRVLDGSEITVTYETDKGKWRNKKMWKLSDSRNQILYNATHINHPSAVWARKSTQNYDWLVSLLDNLCSEYTFRYGKIHKVQHSGLLDKLKNRPYTMKDIGFTPFPQTMPDCYKSDNPVKAYHNFYLGDKIRFAKWKKRQIPSFFAENVDNPEQYRG